MDACDCEDEPVVTATCAIGWIDIVRSFVWAGGGMVEESPQRNGFTFTAVKMK